MNSTNDPEPNMLSTLIISTLSDISSHSDTNKQDCITVLNEASRSILQLSATERSNLDPKIFGHCGSVINNEINSWKMQQSNISVDLVKNCLYCLRASFVNCSSNQYLVASNETLMASLINTIILLFNKELIVDIQQNKTTKDITSDIDQYLNLDDTSAEIRNTNNLPTSSLSRTSLDEVDLSDVMAACATCTANLVVANSTTRHLVWPSVKPIIGHLLGCSNQRVARMWCCFIHNCLLEYDIRNNYITEIDFVTSTMKQLIALDDEEVGHMNDFVQLCINLIVASDGVVRSIWPSSTLKEKLHFIDYLISIIERKEKHCQSTCLEIPQSTITFLTGLFKSDSDQILSMADDKVKNVEPQVIVKLLCFVIAATVSDTFKHLMQGDRSLLITTVYLLRSISSIGESGDNYFTRLKEVDTDEEEEVIAHPAFGYKASLVRLIGIICHKHKVNQDTVRDINGLLLLLENSQHDAKNPLIRENAVFALSNALENNIENQKVVKELEVRGMAKNEGLTKLGLEATIDDNKLNILQASNIH